MLQTLNLALNSSQVFDGLNSQTILGSKVLIKIVFNVISLISNSFGYMFTW